MNEQQRLFLAQARSDFAVFELLRKQAILHECHALHYIWEELKGYVQRATISRTALCTVCQC